MKLFDLVKLLQKKIIWALNCIFCRNCLHVLRLKNSTRNAAFFPDLLHVNVPALLLLPSHYRQLHSAFHPLNLQSPDGVLCYHSNIVIIVVIKHWFALRYVCGLPIEHWSHCNLLYFMFLLYYKKLCTENQRTFSFDVEISHNTFQLKGERKTYNFIFQELFHFV